MMRAVAIVLALVAAAACAYWVFRLRRKKRTRALRPARLECPVVLAHGVFGFVERRAGPLRSEYFRNVPARLRLLGSDVYALQVPLASSVAVRAQHLKEGIEKLGCKRVNIIAHSMGGLDARYAISRLGLGSRVASLITIGTPHQGTPLADLGTDLLGERLGFRKVVKKLGWDVQAFYDLTTEQMEAFNDAVRNVRGVMYASYVGKVDKKRKLNPLLWPTHLFLNERSGENDGLVPATSQSFGETLGVIEADHWAQIGWSPYFDAISFYESVWRELRGRGL